MEHSPRPLFLNHPEKEEAPPASPSFPFRPAGDGGDTTHGLLPPLRTGDLESGKGVRPGVRADRGTKAGLKNITSRVELFSEPGSIWGFGRVMPVYVVDALSMQSAGRSSMWLPNMLLQDVRCTALHAQVVVLLKVFEKKHSLYTRPRADFREGEQFTIRAVVAPHLSNHAAS